MQAAFDGQASFSMQPFAGRAPVVSSASRYESSFGFQSPAPYSPPSPPLPFGGGSMSSSSYNYASQQMSGGPFGFTNAYQSGSYNSYDRQSPFGFTNAYQSANYSSFDRQSPFGNTSYSHAESTNYFNQGGGFDSSYASRFDCAGNQPPVPLPDPRGDCRGFGQRSQWSDTGVNGNTSTVDLGNYKLDFDKSKSSMLLTDKQSGQGTKIWGDPHIELNAGTGSKTSGMFNGPLTFDLPDRTSIAVNTQPGKCDPKVSYADNVTITQGNRAYVVNGLSQQNKAPLTVQRSNDGFALAQQASGNAMHLYATQGGTGWINGETHQAVKASDFHA